MEAEPELSALAGKGGSQRGKMALLTGPSACLPPASDSRLQEKWAGLVRTCLQPASLPSRSGENCSPGSAFYFLKPDQRWDPAGSPSKISAMWSLGVSAGETWSWGRGHPPQALAAGVRGSEARGEAGVKLLGGPPGPPPPPPRPEASATGRTQPWPPHRGAHSSSLKTGTPPRITLQSWRPSQLQPESILAHWHPTFTSLPRAVPCSLLQGIALYKQEALGEITLLPSAVNKSTFPIPCPSSQPQTCFSLPCVCFTFLVKIGR